MTDRTAEAPVVFVGNSRNEYRPIVKWAVEKGLSPAVYGTRWEQFLPRELIKGANVENRSLGNLYSSANVVLNDHWESMREYGFVSNRLFDAVASGARVVSDAVPSAGNVFGDAVLQVHDAEELRQSVELASRQGDIEARERAAQAVSANHSFDSRASEIVGDTLRFLGLPARGEPEANSDGRVASPAVRLGKPIKVNAVIRWEREYPQSSAFIRLLSPLTAEALAGAVDFKFVRSTEALEAEPADITIVQRAAFDNVSSSERFADHLRKSKSKLIVDNDDAFCFIDKDHSEYTLYRDKISALDTLIRQADAAWFSTKALADAYALVRKAEIMPNMIDPRIWRDYRNPRPPIGKNGKLRLLYMGTATHDGDFTVIASALDEVARLRPGSFGLTIVGAVRKPPNREWITKLNPPVTHQAYPRFVRWLLRQSPFDVGLAPLRENAFNDCKSDLKYLDYAALGILPVLSDCTPYRDSATVSGGAVLVQNTHESWRDALLNLVDDFDRFVPMSDAAEHYVWSERHVSTLSCLQMESLNRVLSGC